MYNGRAIGRNNTDATIERVRSSSYHLPFPRNRRFAGRRAVLDELMQKLIVSKECRKMAIVGLGGIGKSQVALEFAYSIKDKRPEYSIFWVPALSIESFKQACFDVVRTIGIPTSSEDKEGAKELFKQHLSSSTAGKWLLIIDNADDMNTLLGASPSTGLAHYLPESEGGLTIFTTRHQEAAQSLAQSDILEMEKVDKDEAINF